MIFKKKSVLCERYQCLFYNNECFTGRINGFKRYRFPIGINVFQYFHEVAMISKGITVFLKVLIVSKCIRFPRRTNAFQRYQFFFFQIALVDSKGICVFQRYKRFPLLLKRYQYIFPQRY